MIVPRVRVKRFRSRCDDDECSCPDPFQHPIAVAAATVGLQLFGEFLSRKLFGEEQPKQIVLVQQPEGDEAGE